MHAQCLRLAGGREPPRIKRRLWGGNLPDSRAIASRCSSLNSVGSGPEKLGPQSPPCERGAADGRPEKLARRATLRRPCRTKTNCSKLAKRSPKSVFARQSCLRWLPLRAEGPYFSGRPTAGGPVDPTFPARIEFRSWHTLGDFVPKSESGGFILDREGASDLPAELAICVSAVLLDGWQFVRG